MQTKINNDGTTTFTVNLEDIKPIKIEACNLEDDDSLDAFRYCVNDILTTQRYAWSISMPLINIQSMIERVVFNDPATIIFWTDGSKTVVKRSEDDSWDEEKGICMAIIKKMCGKTSFIKNYTRESFDDQNDINSVQDGIAKSIDALSKAVKKASLKGGKK